MRINFGYLFHSMCPMERTRKKLGIVQPMIVDIGGILKSLFSLPKDDLSYEGEKLIDTFYYLLLLQYSNIKSKCQKIKR